MEQKTLTRQRLIELLDFDESVGAFYWKKRRKGVSHDGKRAGCLSKSDSKIPVFYWKIRVDTKLYYAHRLVWLWVHGELPAQEIDHIDGCTINNNPKNLRLASSAQNKFNTRMRKTNTTGFKGVVVSGQYWRAQASVEGRPRHLGSFRDPKDAARCYDLFIKEMHGEFAVTNELLGLI